MFDREKAFFEKLIRTIVDPMAPYRVKIAKVGLALIVILLLIASMGFYTSQIMTLWLWFAPFGGLIFVLILYFDHLRRKDPETMEQLERDSAEQRKLEEEQKKFADENYQREKAERKAFNKEYRRKNQQDFINSLMFWKK